MVFSSITFLTIFLPFVAGLYYLPGIIADKKDKYYLIYKNAILCIASLLFYAWGEPKNIILMLISIVFNYVIALHIDKTEKDKLRKILMTFSVIFNVGLLFFFKYSGFVAENISLFSKINLRYVEPALPIGISFYTFQILSYVIDVYRRKVCVQKNILNFALYISMFPQLIAGPIVQYSDIDTQLSERNESLSGVTEGIFIFVVGLAKKTILANAAGSVFEELTIDGTGTLSMLGAWGAIIFYAFQIYFDFSGYSDMAKGLGGIFGFTFPDNFLHPYVATSITDFWRRWHITLSSWFRDYVYIPLGGNRCSKKRHIFNLFVVWSLTGLWHGASWNFVLWGIYYFILLVLEKFVLNKIIEKTPLFLRRLITFIFVLFGWVLFASTDFSMIVSFFASLFGFHGLVDNNSIFILWSEAILLLIMAVSSTELFRLSEIRFLKKKEINIIARYVLSVLLFAVSLICLIGDTYNPFLYFRF